MQSSRFIAIAVLAIVIIPIGMGYVLSMEEVERSGWQTTDQINISDDLLNSETPYYQETIGPGINGMMFSNRVGGNGVVGFVSPIYREVSSVPSSLPVYTSTDSYINTSAANTISISTQKLDIRDGTITAYDGSVVAAGADLYRISAPSGMWMFADGSQLQPLVSGGSLETTTAYVSFYDGDRSILYADGFGRPIAEYFAFRGSNLIAPKDFTITPYNLIEVTGDNYSLETVRSTSSAMSAIRLELSDGSIESRYFSFPAIVSGSTVALGGDVFTNVSRVYVSSNVNVLKTTISPVAGSYANPSYGWGWPSGARWIAGSLVDGMTIYASMPTDGLLSLSPTTSDDTVLSNIVVQRSGGMVSVYDENATSQSLGRYSHVMIRITSDDVIVSGISGWPSMYSPAIAINSITIDRTSGPLYYVTGSATDNWSFRVDSAEILGGYFPSTRDYTLSPSELLPNQSYAVSFPSIGIYGDSITLIAGDSTTTYPVVDGSVTIDGEDYRLVDATLSSTIGDGMYSISINGDEIMTASGPLSITLNGEWSLAANLYKVEPFTSKSLEWIPGEFVLDEEGAALVGVITCVAVFVALAMVRPFSGGKMIMLAIVCGGGLIMFLLIM